jgi:hypothetical protein
MAVRVMICLVQVHCSRIKTTSIEAGTSELAVVNTQ